MQSSSRRGSADDGFIAAMCFAILASIITGAVSWGSGHDRGVRDALAGKYTIVNMPDGTTRVCEVKHKETGDGK